MTVFELVGRIVLEGAREVEEELDKLKDGFKGASDGLRELTDNAKDMVIAGGALLGSLTAIAYSTSHAADEINNMSLRTGMSVEAIQELSYAANSCGTSIGTIEAGMRRLARGVEEAQSGSMSYAESLAKVGLNYQDIATMAPEDQFYAVAGALAEVQDSSERAAMAQELFGRSGTQLLPMLAQGTDGLNDMRQSAKNLGGVMSDSAIKAGVEFNQSITNLRTTMSGFKNEIASSIMPVLGTFINGLLIPGFNALRNIINKIPGPLKDIAVVLVTVTGGFLATAGAVGLAIKGFEKMWPMIMDGIKFLGDLVPKIIQAGKAFWDFAVGIVTRVIPALIAKLALMGPWGWAILAAAAAITGAAIYGITRLASGGGGGEAPTELPTPDLEGLEQTPEGEGEAGGGEETEEIPAMQRGGVVLGSRRGTLVRVGENYTSEMIAPLSSAGGSNMTTNVNFNFEPGSLSVRSDSDIDMIAEALHQRIIRAERRLSS